MRATEHNKPAKAWPIGANRTKLIPWPALPVSTFFAVRKATKYWFDAHTMDAGCTCCCTCSTGFNNNPTGRKNRWHTFNTSKHTFLLDWWNSDWLPIPHCEPDAVLSLESLMRSLCCLEQMLRVTQVAHSTMSRPSLSLTDWHVYWHVFWQNATYLAYS